MNRAPCSLVAVSWRRRVAQRGAVRVGGARAGGSRLERHMALFVRGDIARPVR